MGLYAGDPAAWINNIYQFEETDVVQGGPTGIDNVPLKDLADRTAWLRDQIGISTRFVDEVLSTGGDIDATMAGKLVIASSTGSINLTLANPNTFLKGSIIPILGYCDAGAVINILSPAAPIIDKTSLSAMYMHDKEQVLLVAMDTHFRVLRAEGNFYCAGEEIKSRKSSLNNAIALQGQILNRARYPRLWAFVQSLTFGQEVVSETTWNTGGLIYQGCFTTGDGSTTFRLPDERGMFERMMDGGRGVDLSRLHNYPGGYEADQNKAHTHDLPLHFNDSRGGDQPHTLYNDPLGDTTPITKTTTSSGGNEVIVKNIGKINLIKF